MLVLTLQNNKGIITMRKYISILLIFVLAGIVIIAADGKKYGEDLTLTDKTNISEILSKPDEFVGKKVLVEGLVVNVCEKRGCWMELASDKDYESIRIKVDDGVIVFPMEAKGEKAVVEGEVYSYNVEEEAAACSDKAKSACSDEKMKGKTSETKTTDAKSCCSKEKKVKTVYQIKATGAVI
jgi:hypothetical protein